MGIRVRIKDNIHNRKHKDQNCKEKKLGKKNLIEIIIEKVWGERITHVTQLYGCVNILKFIPSSKCSFFEQL